jgi:CelD/BcsL family acetyltransferase involved in cellulose biosynthesis
MRPNLMLQTDNHDLTVGIFDSFEAAGIGRDEWDHFVSNVAGDIYVTFDWCRIWWRHYGQGRRLRLFVFRAGNGVVGLAPMFIEHVWLGPIGLKMAKRVGADFALTIFALPLAANYAERACHELIMTLIEGENCDAVWFGIMPGNDATADRLRELCRIHCGRLMILRDVPEGPHTVFGLPDSFEVFVANLNKRQRQNYRRDINLLSKSFKVEKDVVRDPLDLSRALETFKLLHDRQWRAEGKLGHFGDWPNSGAFNSDLVQELSRHGRCRVLRLFLDGRLVALQYAFVFGDCCYWRLPARAVDDGLARFGLGRIGLMQLIEAMIGEGVCRIEAGRGHYEYKVQLGGEELEARSIVIGTRRAGAALRSWLFFKLSDILHLVYYRIWRQRLAPRLRLSRPLWRIWIRCHL